jgi:hypothetical protein
LVEHAPDTLGGGMVMARAEDAEFVPTHLRGRLICSIAVCYDGSTDDGPELIAPLRDLEPEVDLVGPMQYADFQSMMDDPPGKRNYWGAEYLAELGQGATAAFVASSAQMRSALAQTNLIPWGGAVARVRAGDTPMTNRDAPWVFHPFAVWESAADDEANIAWTRQSVKTMRRFSTGGVYLNFIGDEGSSRVRAAFGDENFARLAAVKAEYDPENLFHRNHNIRPAL